jgi:putative endonuclease
LDDFYTYILASQRDGTLYIGSTEGLVARVSQHKQGMRPGFTSKHGVDALVYFEPHDTREGAFRRERRMKKWNRTWKIELIEQFNPGWRDLFEDLL